MSLELDAKSLKWLIQYKVISAGEAKQLSSSLYEIPSPMSNQFQNGTKIAPIVVEIYKKVGLPIPATLNHLKNTNGTAAQLYNWNILNDALKKVNFQIDSEVKNLIINGDRIHLAMTLRKLIALYDNSSMQDSLASFERPQQPPIKKQPKQQMPQSLTLSYSQQPKQTQSQSQFQQKPQKQKQQQHPIALKQDLIQFVLNQLTQYLSLTRKQAIALLSDGNKYLAHVLVKGIKGQFGDIQSMLQKFYAEIQYIIEKMAEQNDMCYYFLQIVKPCLLSKSEEIAQWGCRILTKIAHQLAQKQLLPLAYDWFIQQAGGLSTTILSLSRHPKLSQNVVPFILQFSRYNVTQLFTIELRKITNNDNLVYVKFMLLIFGPLTESKISAEELLQSGAIDYWVQITIKGAEVGNSKELRMYCIQFLVKIWRAYPAHIQETIDQVNNIMNQIKRGIRDQSQIMRFNLMQLMFDLLDQFASKKNPYASIVYKKLTFLFIQNHEQLTMREFILRNLQQIFQKYQSIPVEIFLQPFIKQIKISESKSYLVNIFDMEFINVAVKHRKLKIGIGLELFDLLAKTKLNSYSFSVFATQAMEVLVQRFLGEEIFLEYTVKLVKISLAMFYSTLKHKKPYDDQERLQAQKRAEIVNMIISFIERSNANLNQQIKNLVVHVKVQILNRLGIQHKGIQRILGYFKDVEQAVRQAMKNAEDELTSNATSTAKQQKSGFHLPKINNRNIHHRDQTQSQQSLRSRATKYSQNSRQQFPLKDYTQFAQQDQKKFLKQNGLGLKKKLHPLKKSQSTQKQPQAPIDPKIQQQLQKIKQKKLQTEQKKLQQRSQTQKKKQLLKQKIQKQLEQRNIKQGYRGQGMERDVEVRVLFQENQISGDILNQEEKIQGGIDGEEDRDLESIGVVMKRYAGFIKKIYNRYANLKGAKKDLQQMQNPIMSQVDLLRLCKQKSLLKSKQTIIQLLKLSNNKSITSLPFESFPKFLQHLCLQSHIKSKPPTNMLLGQHMKQLLKKMAQGENFKLDDDDDAVCRELSQKIRYNPHMELPAQFKKIYERVYKVNEGTSWGLRKAIPNEGILVCFEIVNQLLRDCFKIHVIQEEVKFMEEGRVVHKRQAYIPPKPIIKKEKEKQQSAVPLLTQKQAPTGQQSQKPKKVVRSASRPAQQRDYEAQRVGLQTSNQSKSRSKIVNAAERKKLEQQQQARRKKQIQQQLRKQRALQVKRKLQQQQQQRQKQKQKKLQQKKQQQQKQQQTQKKQKQRKQKYQKQQKQKLQKFKKQQQQKQKQQKMKQQQQKKKEEQQRKMKLKQQLKRDEEKRKEEGEKMRKERELSEEKNKRKQEQQEKQKQVLKKQIEKKLEQQKEKHEISKIVKELLGKMFHEPEIQELVSNKYKEQFKALYTFGKEYNQFKLGKVNDAIEMKGWLNLAANFGFCSADQANKMFKTHIKEKNANGISYEQLAQLVFQLAVKGEVQKDLQDYDKAKNRCKDKFDSYVAGLKLPKGSQKLKEYFIGLKNQVIKKNGGAATNTKDKDKEKDKQQLTVTNPNGDKETWQIKQ